MITPSALLKDLQRKHRELEDDLRAREREEGAVRAEMRGLYAQAVDGGRTGEAYEVWLDAQLTQVAAGWLLGTVFVRFLEDNGLLAANFIAGPSKEALDAAAEVRKAYFAAHPALWDNDYLLHVFTAAGALPGLGDFFDPRHNPLWIVPISGDAAAALLEFWRRTDSAASAGTASGPAAYASAAPVSSTAAGAATPSAAPPSVAGASAPTGAAASSGTAGVPSGRLTLVHDFSDPAWNTRFLGNLYQDLSEDARERYALLQTPEFVEEFILDRTLTPAIEAFGYEAVRMIDPTCGSGHFLLGAFQRLFDLWSRNRPDLNERQAAVKALDAVHGVDLNPFAVAIARFRLLIAALRACGIARLADAPEFTLHLAVGDSLLHGAVPGEITSEGALRTGIDAANNTYRTEDPAALARILGRKYHAVVGNPPYITVKDKKLSAAYRAMFQSCSGKYSLVCPFMERFFDLACEGNPRERVPAGFVGKITGSSFMKREFGKELVEKLFPQWDLTHVIDTDKAQLLGHATGTVILVGRNQKPTGDTVRLCSGLKKQEPAPADASTGFAWLAIRNQIDNPGTISEWVSVGDVPRQNFHKHPWSIGGGGAVELKEEIEKAGVGRLKDVIEVAGVLGMTNADEIMVALPTAFQRRMVSEKWRRPMVFGDGPRNWLICHEIAHAIFPYHDGRLVGASDAPELFRWLWPARTILGNRATFGGGTYFSEGRPWWEWHQIVHERLKSMLTITWGEITTHNNFVLDRAGKLFKQAAPLIKLEVTATGDDHLALVGLLNSSVACFWLKQVCHDKGAGGIGGGIAGEPWEHRFAFNATQVSTLPIAAEKPLALARELDRLAQELQRFSPRAVLADAANHSREALDRAREQWRATLYRMISLQEELDWFCYRAYGLIDRDDLLARTGLDGLPMVPPLHPGQRTFEIGLARGITHGANPTTWFERHKITPLTEPSADWPGEYLNLFLRRQAANQEIPALGLVEGPEYKRRWNLEPWDEQLAAALRAWMLDRLEVFFFDADRMVPAQDEFARERTLSVVRPLRTRFAAGEKPALCSTGQLADIAALDADWMRVAVLHAGRADFDPAALVRRLVEEDAVPFLPSQRYKDSGLRKRGVWERVWEQQRQEDAIDAEVAALPETDPQFASISPGQIPAAKAALAKARKQEAVGVIPVPPKYKNPDFRKPASWRLRGELDVPKERWVLYPGAERESDPSPVVAWAGWDALQQALALSAWYQERTETDGWSPARLRPLLAGLLDLLPWLRQWHNGIHPEYQQRMGDFFAEFVQEEARTLGLILGDLEETRVG